MPREKLKTRSPNAATKVTHVVTKIDYEWSSSSGTSKVLRRAPLPEVLHNWERWLGEVVTNSLESRDMSMSDIRVLEHVQNQVHNAKEHL